MVRVWFNHWFSTSYGLIELMKKDAAEDIYVIASNKQINSVIQKVCDEWYEDSLASGEEYIEYCIDFCKEHRIDVFAPRRHMVEISKNRARFEEIGVKLLIDDYEKIALLNDKAATYKFLSALQGVNVPDYEVVDSVSGFESAYKRLRAMHDQVCVKFVKDEGAMSYRRIVDSIDPEKLLRVYPGADIDYSAYVNALKSLDSMDDLMVMPYLSGTEVSVDCLKTQSGLIAIPRYKSPSRHEEIIFDEDILQMTNSILEATGLEAPCNVQYRFEKDVPYLLEINTRMSGGLQMSCCATGVNIPNIALNKILGKDVKWSLNKNRRTVSYIEIPQVIE